MKLFKRVCKGQRPEDLIFTAPGGRSWHSGYFAARTGDRPYAHLGNEVLRNAIRKAATATRSTRTAAEQAEAKANRAEQQAAAGTGPNALALVRRYQDLTARAEAIHELRSLRDTIAGNTQTQRGTNERLGRLEKQLSATRRFGRPSLRGDNRAGAEAERDTLQQQLADAARELETLYGRISEL